jgi:hypothetical protein
MEATILCTSDMFTRADRFYQEHAITPPLPRATAAHADMVSANNAILAAAQKQTLGGGQSAGGVDLREVYARDLRNFLKEVNRTARTFTTEHPGIAPIFRLPRSGSYPALLATANAVIEAATPIQASFVDAGMPATFLTELAALVTAFTAATGQKAGGGITRTMGTAGLRAQATLGIIAARKLDACVRNHYRGNAEVLAGWAHARRIERAPQRTNSTPTPPPPLPPSDGGGQSSGATFAVTNGSRLNGVEGGHLA